MRRGALPPRRGTRRACAGAQAPQACNGSRRAGGEPRYARSERRRVGRGGCARRRTRKVGRRAASVDHVGHREHRMPREHPRTGVAHDDAHLLAHRGAVAVDLAVGAGRLVVAEHAAVEPARRVVHERAAAGAQAVVFRVQVVAVDAHHRADRLQLAREPRMARAVLHLAGGRRDDRGLLSVMPTLCSTATRAAMTCVKRLRQCGERTRQPWTSVRTRSAMTSGASRARSVAASAIRRSTSDACGRTAPK